MKCDIGHISKHPTIRTFIDDNFNYTDKYKVDVNDVVINDDLRIIETKDLTIYFDTPLLLSQMNKSVMSGIHYSLTVDFSIMTFYNDHAEYKDYVYFNCNIHHDSDNKRQFVVWYFHEDEYDMHIKYQDSLEINELDLLHDDGYIERSRQDAQKKYDKNRKYDVDHYLKKDIPLDVSDETYATTFEQLLKLPISYIHNGVLYKRYVMHWTVHYTFTRHKPLCCMFYKN